jgi:ATP-dependent Lon protease
VETLTMPGKGKLTVTGKLGDVMKESAQAAVSYVRSRATNLLIDDKFYKKLDLHIHIPEGRYPRTALPPASPCAPPSFRP